MADLGNKIATYVFMDLETTGLYSIGETPRIVEMSFVAVCRKHAEGNNIADSPRVLDKLVLCVNPGGKPMTCGASFMTGLYNDILEDLPVFDENAVKMLSLFLSRLPQPVCLLAHNGDKFDFPMLKMELERLALSLPADVLCADTLEALRAIDPTRETTQGHDLNGAMAGCRLLSTPTLSNQRPTYFSSEITPVKSDNDTTGPFAHPPPAPRKKRSRPENGRHLGNMRFAKRRLLQDESCGLNKGVFSLDTCAASPPPSPQGQSRLLARRRLAFTDGSGESSHSNGSASVPVEFRHDLEKGDNSNELLPFPDDFSDSDSEVSVEEQSVDDVSHNSNDHSNTSNQVADLTTVSNNYTDSLPDEDLISAVDQLLDQTPRNQSSGANNCSVIVCRGTDSLEAQNQGHPDTNSSATQNQDGQKTTDTSATQNLDEEKATNSSVTQYEDGQETTNSSTTHNQEGEETTNSSATHSHVQQARGRSSENNSAENLSCNEASDIYSGQVTPRKRDQSEVKTVTATTKDVKNYTNQMTAMHRDNQSDCNQPTTSVPSTSTSNNRKSFKLTEIYKRVFGHPPKVSHAAEDDCITLVKIIQTCAEEFGKWLDEHALPFSNVKKMY